MLVVGVLLLTVVGLPARSPDGPVRILLVGDSITQGQAGDWTWRYRLWQALQQAGEREVDLVGPADDLRNGSQDYRDPEFDRDHAALWGAPLSPPAYDVGDLGRDHRPDVAVIELGVNDLGWQREQPVEVAAGMTALIQELRGAAPGVDVVVVRVPVRAVPGVEELNDLYDDVAAELDTTDERVVVARADDGFVSDPASPEPDTYDGLHPNARGEVKIAAAVADALEELGIVAGPLAVQE